MHAHPEPLFHRDIRWPNIIRDAGTATKWFLVDWDNASMSPTTEASHLNRSTHPPAIFKDNHGAEVDIWGVGKLIVDAVTFVSDIPPPMVDVGYRMIEGKILTAAQALADIRLLSTPC